MQEMMDKPWMDTVGQLVENQPCVGQAWIAQNWWNTGEKKQLEMEVVVRQERSNLSQWLSCSHFPKINLSCVLHKLIHVVFFWKTDCVTDILLWMMKYDTQQQTDICLKCI
jgi:hypothetical protein